MDAANQANCGLHLRWGDGAVTDIRVEDKNAIPYKATHAYAKPGSYSVVAEPGKVKSSLGCVGKKVTALIKVAAPPPPAPAAPVAPAAAAPASMAKAVTGPSCPDGWKLDAKSVVKKTGAYRCTSKAGTATPEKRPACPGDLGYFENSKKGILGCKP